jgi:ribosome maturation factor RimP
MQDNDALFAELEPILAGSGLTLVELSATRRGARADVHATVYSPSGTGTEECSKAHRLMYPRLQAALGIQDVMLEVASPGIDRALKNAREWSIFKGRGARVLLREGGEWIRGRIIRVDGKSVVLSFGGEERGIELAAIAKARLDSSQEGD